MDDLQKIGKIFEDVESDLDQKLQRATHDALQQLDNGNDNGFFRKTWQTIDSAVNKK